MAYRGIRRGTGLALVLWALGPAAAAEEGSAAAADEIIVEARKREESLQRIPVTGSVLSEQEILDFGGIQSDLELGEYLTGVTIDEEGNPEYFIRGAGTGRSPQTASATTQLLQGAEIAGGYGGRSFERIDTFDVRQIEVYRGAQGSLYGRNAVGGVLNLIAQEPNDKFSYRGQASWDFTTEELRAEAVVNQPLSDTLFVRLGVFGDTEDGHFENQFLDEPFNNTSAWGTRLGIKKLFDGWDALLMVHYGEARDASYLQDRRAFKPGVFGTVPNVLAPPLGASPGTVLPRDVEGNVLPAGSSYDFPVNSGGDPFVQAFDTPGYSTENTLNALFRINADLPFATLTSITNVRSRVFDQSYDADVSYVGGIFGGTGTPGGTIVTNLLAPLGAAGQCTEPLFNMTTGMYVGSSGIVNMQCVTGTESESFIATQELRLVSPSEGRFDWLVGADARLLRNPILDSKTGRNNLAALEAAAPMNAAMSVSAAVASAIENQITDSDTVNLAFGLYGSVGYDITDALNLAFSIRGTYERASIDVVNTDLDTGEEVIRFDDAEHFHNVSPSLTLAYDLGGKLVYASWAQAHRSGGYNRFAGTAVGSGDIAREFDEELANSYEVGFKGDGRWAGGTFRYALDVFRVEYNGTLTSVLISAAEDDADSDPSDQTSFDVGVTNAGDSYVQGVETDLGGSIGDPFSLGGNIFWSGGITYAESMFTSGQFEGRELTFVNTWTWNGNITYRRPFPFLENTGLTLFFNTNFNWQTDTDNIAGASGETDTRKAWNARLGVEGQNWGHAWQLQTFMNNIWDVTYQRLRTAGPVALVTVPGSNAVYSAYERPTSWGLRLTIRGGEEYQ